MNIERRINPAQRNLVILGNMLSLWAGVTPTTQAEKEEVYQLQEAWENALAELRKEAANNSFAYSEQSVKL